jgi:crossover junction endodeoxyribonuclease RusA
VVIIIPYPPSVNTYWRAVKGRVIISKRGREYRDAVYTAINSAFESDDVEDPRPLLGRLQVKITATMPDRRRRDIDNINKAALDALGYAGVFGDDEQIDDLHVLRGEVMKPGCLEVEIKEIETV